MSILVENVEPIGHKSSPENAAPPCSPPATQKSSGIIPSIPRAEEARDTANPANEKEKLRIRIAQLYQLYGSLAYYTQRS